MAYYFIYTSIGGNHYTPHDHGFKFSVLKQFAPNAKRYDEDSEVHQLGKAIDFADFTHSYVIEITDESEAVAFKMMQDQFIDDQSGMKRSYRQGELAYILENPDWDAIYQAGPDIPELLELKNKQSEDASAVNSMNRKHLKFQNEHVYGRETVGMQDLFKEYSAKLEQAILDFRAENKRVSDQLKRQRAKAMKKALTYAIFKAK
jgi:hypothetical protein